MDHVERLHTTVAPDGTPLAYRTCGAPDRRPLVLVHGWAQSSAAWSGPLLEDLAADFRVVAVDLRGHGGSGVPSEGYDDPRRWAGDLAAVLAAEGIGTGRRAVLLGWSYGGIVVSDYLAEEGSAAVAGLVLCGAVTGVSRSPGAAVGPAMRAVAGSGGLDDDPVAAVDALVEFGATLMASGAGADRQRLLGLSLATPPAVRRALLSRRVDHDEDLAALEVPTLVVHGADDTVVPPETGRANAETVPGAQYVELPGCAHAPFLEQRTEFLRTLTDFAARLGAGRPG